MRTDCFVVVSDAYDYELFIFRFQAIECFLAKVKPKSNDDLWDQEAISRFEDLTHGK